MYWRQSIPLFGGLKYNKTSTGKDYISYRKNGIYIYEPVADIKKDIKNIFRLKKNVLDVKEVQKKVKQSFDLYNDKEIFNQIELLKQFNISDDEVVDFIGSAIFDGASFSIEQLNHAKGIFSQIKCSKTKRKEIEQFINTELKRNTKSQNNNLQQLPLQHLNSASNRNNQNIQVIPSNVPLNSVNKKFSGVVDIFRERKGSFLKVSSGHCELKNREIIITANVTKSFFIEDVVEIYKNLGKMFIHVKTRKQPFILASTDIDDLFDAISNLLSPIKG